MMVTRHTPEKDAGEGLCILIRPNRSLSPRGMTMLFAGMLAYALIIGIGFSLAGAWPVAPFAGLELAAVAVALYWLYRHVDDHEMVIIDTDSVTVIRRRGGREWRDDFQRYWTKATLERRLNGYPSRLVLGSHGRFVVIGADVGEEERRDLAARLHEALRRTV